MWNLVIVSIASVTRCGLLRDAATALHTATTAPAQRLHSRRQSVVGGAIVGWRRLPVKVIVRPPSQAAVGNRRSGPAGTKDGGRSDSARTASASGMFSFRFAHPSARIPGGSAHQADTGPA